MTKKDILNKYQYFIKRGDGFIMLVKVLNQLDENTFEYEALTLTKTNTFTSINIGYTKANIIINDLKIIHQLEYEDTYKAILKLQDKHNQLYNHLAK